MNLQPALLLDSRLPATIESPKCPRTGAMVMIAPLTWCGVRPVPFKGRELRMCRSIAQVNSESYRRTLRGLVVTHGHPSYEGRSAFVHAQAGRVDLPDLGFAWIPPERVQVGYTGDELLTVEREGYQLPAARFWVTADATQRSIERGLRQTSLGHFALLDFTPGVHVAPDGTEHPYDVDQVLDATDPRIAEAVASGLVPENLAEMIGANHFASALALGRGLGQSEIERFLGALDSIELGAAPRTFAMIRPVDESGVSGTGHVLDGVVWPSGQVSICWCSGPLDSNEQTPQAFQSFAAFKAIHVDQHPNNQTEFVFHDGQPEPECYAPAATVAPASDSHEGPTMKFLLLKQHGNLIPPALRTRFQLVTQADGAVQVPVPDAIAADPGPVLELMTEFMNALASAKEQMAQMETDAAAKAAQLQQAQVANGEQAMQVKELEGQIDSLRKKAEIGERVELEQVLQQAKTVFGCSDSDITAGEDAAKAAHAERVKKDPKAVMPGRASIIRRTAISKYLGDSHPLLACADSVLDATFAHEVEKAGKRGDSAIPPITLPTFGGQLDRKDDPIKTDGPGVDAKNDSFPY